MCSSWYAWYVCVNNEDWICPHSNSWSTDSTLLSLSYLMWVCVVSQPTLFPYGSAKLYYMSVFLRLNGSLPNNIEIKNNSLFFKGPVTYEFGGTYVCDATNSIGTRSGLVEVNVTGKLRMLIWVIKCVCWCWESFNLGPGDCSSRNVSFVEVE